MNNMTLPSVLIEKILWDLPTEQLVRTSILSKEWRYFWTNIPKVAFREDLFHESTNENQLPVDENELPIMERPPKRRKEMNTRCKLFYAVYQFLLLHQGPIVDFTLSTMDISDTSGDCDEIDQILLHLSRKNTVKKLRLSSMCELPVSIFSFHQLTDLYMADCTINQPPTSIGFGSLTTLCLVNVDINKKALMDILFHNPLIKSFSMLTGRDGILIFDEDDAPIIDLFKCLPVIEHLTFCVTDIEYFGGGAVPRAPATSFFHLKCLHLERMCFLEENWLRFLVHMIRSSPNLEKLKLQMLCEDYGHWMHFSVDDFYPVTMQYYSDIRLEHLIELEIEVFDNYKPNLEFVQLILAKSPVLETVRLMVYDKDAELKMLRNLVPAPHASPTVEIIGVVKEHSSTSC